MAYGSANTARNDYVYGTALPKKEFEVTENPLKKVDLSKVNQNNSKNNKNEEIQVLKRAVSLLCLLVFVFGMISLQISVGAKNYEYMKKIQSIEAKIAIAESENIRLNSALTGITGISTIDNYATQILGMVKAESYQIECIDLSKGDSVIYTSSFIN